MLNTSLIKITGTTLPDRDWETYGKNAYPLPISEIEREEGFDPNDPMAVRFRWVTQGNQVLENWQVSHMRLLGNDAFLPYGSSVLEPARRIWRQMILLEDAMLVHRIVRAPDRRVFYIDVGNVPPEEVANYMEQAQTSLKRSSIVDKQTGRVDLRYNPLSIDEDYFIPVRGGDSGTKIDNVGGQTIAGETQDVEYIQKKLFAALKIPKAYLGYDEGLGAKATLSQEDIRFSRTIARIQRTILSEMNKIAIVHLYCNGFTSEDLLDFKLMLSNPSTIAQQQKLELYNTRFTTAQSALQTAGLVDRIWVQKNILRLTDEEISAIKTGLRRDKVDDLEIEATQLTAPDGPESPAAGMPQFDGGNVELGAGGGIDLGALSEQQSIENEEYPIKVQELINLSLEDLDEESSASKTGTNNSMKVRKRDDPADAGMSKLKYDLKKSIKPPTAKDLLSEKEDFNIDEFLDRQISVNAQMNNTIKSTLQRFDNTYGMKPNTNIIISENNSSDDRDWETHQY